VLCVVLIVCCIFDIRIIEVGIVVLVCVTYFLWILYIALIIEFGSVLRCFVINCVYGVIVICTVPHFRQINVIW
jgi:hypothetical protein